MNKDQRRSFSERYAAGDIPWDSGITPPEIHEVLKELPPGKALDLGCGTGTVMRDLLLREVGKPMASISLSGQLTSPWKS